MKIVALDSSGLVASVAVLEDDTLIAEYTVNYKKTHSQTLLPMLAEIQRMTELDMDTVDAIAVAGGPGSFTGLRIGSATAKGLGLALDIPVIAVPTVDALAYNLYGFSGLICPIMDARRNQTYTGLYRFDEAGHFVVVKKACAVDIGEIISAVNEKEEPVVFLGDGVPVFSDTIREKITVPFSFAPSHLSRQRAGAVGALAFVYYSEGKYETAAAHRPDYLRLSQAERERAEKEKANV
ncbi:MAG: tRNA (adenosine(37)-N6)-threonylcarbamoyltransferase complex dimerization subunit type 1 TsaB [Lachnospiraceae bacterium]|nr:tRNA (adenosine(37)-N6)-threonylcarbamoyltransferase complex dimerization subunit type 1 TsaB [Lachnospiraceae bacterium]